MTPCGVAPWFSFIGLHFTPSPVLNQILPGWSLYSLSSIIQPPPLPLSLPHKTRVISFLPSTLLYTLILNLYVVPVLHSLCLFFFLQLTCELASLSPFCRVSSVSSVQSVQFSLTVVSDSLWLHGLQRTRPPCPLPTPRVYSNSCPLSHWCHPTISSSVVPFSSCLQSFLATGSFQMGQFFASGGQSTGVSASASVLPMNTQDWSPLGWTGWISLQSKGLSRIFSNTTVQKHQFFGAQLSL